MSAVNAARLAAKAAAAAKPPGAMPPNAMPTSRAFLHRRKKKQVAKTVMDIRFFRKIKREYMIKEYMIVVDNGLGSG